MKNVFDEVGYWSEVKLEIIKEYVQAYSTILAKQTQLKHVYIDAFAGTGVHISKTTKEFISGSPLNALLVKPPFTEYHLIDIQQAKVEALRSIAQEKPHQIYVYEGDCNEILINQVFPKVQYKNYKRGLCLLDPYGLNLAWEVIQTAGNMKSIEIFLNFPVMDMNRNVLWRNPDKVEKKQKERLNRFWGDESWREAAYTTQGNLFELEEKTSNQTIAKAFRSRLEQVAGFSHVLEPIPMRNSTGATVYYLYFASPKPVAAKIVKAIFDKYRNRGL